MELDEYVTLISDAIERGETVVFAARCTICYSGRAESFLPEGDRLFIIKKDKALIVHQPHGNNPVNYMKPGTTHSLTFKDGTLYLVSKNSALKERIDAIIKRIHFYNSGVLTDTSVITVAGTEEDMSNMLYQHPELIEVGFTPVSREEQTKYGFIDLLGTDKDGVMTVVECKRYAADLSAVTQLRRYVEKVMVSKGITKVRGILAAPKITENAKRMLEDWGFGFVLVKPPKYLEEFTKRQSTLEGF